MTTANSYSTEANGQAKAAKLRADAGQIKESVAALGQHLREDTLDIAKSAKTEAHKKLDDLNARANGYVDTLKKELTDQPLRNVAIAFAAGAVLSLLLRRR